MSAERARKNVLLRHPILIGFATIVILAVIFMPKGEEYKKLDYSKPVYTGESAIVCPKSLLFDLRADHGPNAIFEAFTAVLHRDEKARALGCEIVRGGIPVTAHRMSSPYDEYVSLSLGGTQSADFFTMEGDLENGTSTENSANDSTGTPKTAAQVMLDGYRDDLSRFQKQFPTLEKPIPNLRWFDDHVEGADAQEDVELVTPFGPCILMIGNTPAGYSLQFLDSPYIPNESGRLLGSYPKRATAIQAAEEYCKQWYISESSKPANAARDEHLWFTPDTQVATSTVQTNDVPESSDDPDAQPAAPIERREPTQTQSALPAVAEKPYRWELQPNGDEALIGPTGKCATLAGLSTHDPNKTHLILSDGSTKVFDAEETDIAMQEATKYCTSHQP
jgi:hypothetical protein